MNCFFLISDESPPPIGSRFFRVLLLTGFSIFLCTVSIVPRLEAAPLDSERSMLARGQYKEAIDLLQKEIAGDSGNAKALALLIQARAATGDYRKGFEEGEAFLKRTSDPDVAESTAGAALEIGEYERAAALVEKDSSPRGIWTKGLVAEHKGDQEAAGSAFRQLAGILSQGRRLSAEDRALAAAALAKLNRFKEANDAYREALKAEPDNAAIKTEWGNLLAEKHNPPDAQGLYREALQANEHYAPAMLGLAELAEDRWEGQAAEWVARAFNVNPNLAEAHLLLARMSLEQDDYDAAAKEIDAALQINPRFLDAWSLRAAVEYLKSFGKGNNAPEDGEAIAFILKENPHYGRVFADLGDFCVLKHTEASAVAFYRRALALDPSLDEARANLGINLFRLGEKNEPEARQILEDAYNRDPYNVWTVNTLRLMDSFSKFDTFETLHFSVKLQKKESAVLRPFVEPLLEETIQDIGKRYGYMPSGKVTFEMYPDHEDFAVRTLGLPGLGALGATLGGVVAMDSPSGRPVGEFHWGSTLWHELGHVITLGMTDDRVPRWFTEGLSVYEETKARPGWGDPMDFETIHQLQEGKLLPIEKLNAGYVHPQYPGQIVFAYFEGGMVCQFIAEKYGFKKIVDMLHAYAKGSNDADTIQNALGVTLPEFDREFVKYVKEKTYGFGEAVDLKWASEEHDPQQLPQDVEKNPRNYFAHLRFAAELSKKSDCNGAIREADAAKNLFPLYVGKGNPYEIAASCYEKLGQKEKAVAELQQWRDEKGRDPEAFKKFAQLLEDLGRPKDAIKALEEAEYVALFDVSVHDRLGRLYLAGSNPASAVREYQVVLALGPADPAGAHYQLASAYNALADTRKARSEVLAALEIAPGYRPAQKLLLELSGK